MKLIAFLKEKMKIERTAKTRFIFFLVSDAILIASAVYLGFALRFEFVVPAIHLKALPVYIALCVVVLLPLYYYERLYYFTWGYVSISNLINIVKALTFGFLIFGLLLFLGRENDLANRLPRSIIIIDYILIFTFTSALRLSKRLYSELSNKIPGGHNRKILIIGAGDAAEQLIRSIKQTADYPFRVAGVLDDNELKQKTNIHNIPVMGRIVDLPKIKKREGINGIIIAIPSAEAGQIKQITELAQKNGINYIKILPSLAEFINDRISLRDIRDINVEDLLGRKKIDISFNEIKKLVAGQRVLITGAAGSIGFELVKQICKFSPEHIIALDMDETGIFRVENYLAGTSLSYQAHVINILNKNKLDTILNREKPSLIFHAAAYKHVKLMETHPDEAIINNILGTWNLAQSAHKNQVEKFIFISTDKAVNPSSVMGMTKRLAEMLTLYYNQGTKFISVRFGNVLGSRGSVVPIFKEQILAGGPVTITHPEMQRYFMVPSEAILLVLQAAAFGQGGEIFVLDMGRPVKIVDLAETMIRLSGLEPNRDIQIIFTSPSPGEKLFEEILTTQENMQATKHKEIYITPNSNNLEQDAFFGKIEKLIKLAKKGEMSELKTLMQGILDA
ncbi:MAG TPA: hypothetical protein DDX47_00365 [Candidatus Jacksonbacteria bacterium]|nr:MAG: Polysaccharide biosynthesis protein CapD [Parcubacteria group bacterium GW2011_GWC2_44_22]HBH45809.1 hypothetical protein [Candidatus Jacksonbacteria bacterium]HCC50487.1 hypothetical protein [Candidatus Jacksonbacteria bacterium]HCE48706.1 hypothetical protein [Candidatus Jacksonbacteria bacterium]HCR14883.1 hypothetical protein [Candidatus Jacksonbacteria bacterium]